MAAKRLVIVESPTKATKIAGFLGSDYIVESSRGHVRDLPTSAAEVPAKYKGEKWARTGVDVDNDFRAIYVVSPDKRSTMKDLKAKLAGVDELLLATDGDREGEAIAWHLMDELKPKVPVKRMVFHEITRSAIEEAVTHPRELDVDLVDAQETRRILDRLYGYEVSRRAACSRWPRGSSSTGSASGSLLFPRPTGISTPTSTPDRTRTPATSRPGSPLLGVCGWHRAATSTRTAG